MTDLFSFNGVSLEYAGVAALNDVTAALPEGSLSVVAGTSGSGKSTLLRLCNRLEVPTAGTVRFRGTDLTTVDPLQLRRKVGMVFQRPAVFPGTVRDNLLVASREATETEMAEMLAMAELDGTFLDRTGDDLSGGEAQRVCLARTLICQPDVLLMDEPTAALHPAASLALESTVQELAADRSVDVIWVTHDQAQLDRLAQHLLVLCNGRVTYNGTPGTPGAQAALETLVGEGAADGPG